MLALAQTGHVDTHNVRKRGFRRALRKAGLRQVRIHDLRHGYATLLLQQGESLAYVRDQLGHGSIQLTVDTYGHLIPGANREAVNRLDLAPFRNPGATKRAAAVSRGNVSEREDWRGRRGEPRAGEQRTNPRPTGSKPDQDDDET